MTTTDERPLVTMSGADLKLAEEQHSWTGAQIAALEQLGLRGADDADLQVFFHVCKRTGLDPFARQIYMIYRNDPTAPNGRKATIQTGIDGGRLVAQRASRRDRVTYGYEDTLYRKHDGTWTDCWDDPDLNPVAVRVTVLRDGMRFPHIAHWREFVQTKNNKPTRMWTQMPSNQLAKCLPPQAVIETDRGPLTIGQIVSQRLAVKVRSINLTTGVEEWRPVVNYWRNGSISEWVRLSVHNGTRSNKPRRLTHDHPLWTPQGWVKAGDLKVGDMVGVASPTVSREQHQVIQGGLLGDGSLTDQGGNPLYMESHATGQRAYLEWKAAALASLGATLSEGRNNDGTGKVHDVVRMRTRSLPSLAQYRDMKPVDRLTDLNALGLAVWLMDDGGIKPTGAGVGCQPYIRLFCCGFGAGFADRAAEWFTRKVGVTPKVLRRDKNPYLQFSVADSAIVLSAVADHIMFDPETRTKCWVAGPIPQGLNGYVFTPLIAVEHVQSQEPQGRYDIEVEQTHTFLYGGMVVSNCAEMGALRKAFPLDLSGIYEQAEMVAGAIESVTTPGTPNPDALPVAEAVAALYAQAVAATGDGKALAQVWADGRAANLLDEPITHQGVAGKLGNLILHLRNAPDPSDDVVDADVVEEPAKPEPAKPEPVKAEPVAADHGDPEGFLPGPPVGPLPCGCDPDEVWSHGHRDECSLRDQS
ncbi:MAG: recombinase RecT [Rhodoglobus sp.]